MYIVSLLMSKPRRLHYLDTSVAILKCRLGTLVSAVENTLRCIHLLGPATRISSKINVSYAVSRKRTHAGNLILCIEARVCKWLEDSVTSVVDLWEETKKTDGSHQHTSS